MWIIYSSSHLYCCIKLSTAHILLLQISSLVKQSTHRGDDVSLPLDLPHHPLTRNPSPTTPPIITWALSLSTFLTKTSLVYTHSIIVFKSLLFCSHRMYCQSNHEFEIPTELAILSIENFFSFDYLVLYLGLEWKHSLYYSHLNTSWSWSTSINNESLWNHCNKYIRFV